MAQARYLIALGSNQRHHRHGPPQAVLRAAIAALAAKGIAPEAVSPTIASLPLGPSSRRYANSAALIETALPPRALLTRLKQMEGAFGRRGGQRWGSRVLDLDIILWSGGRWHDQHLTIPHRLWRERAFVLQPIIAITPDWRDPVSRLSVRQLAMRHRKPTAMAL